MPPVMPGRPAARPAGIWEHRPTQVRAITWTGTNLSEISSFFGRPFTTVPLPGTGLCIPLATPTGTIYAAPTDVITESPDGDLMPLPGATFDRDFHLIESQPA